MRRLQALTNHGVVGVGVSWRANCSPLSEQIGGSTAPSGAESTSGPREMNHRLVYCLACSAGGAAGGRCHQGRHWAYPIVDGGASVGQFPLPGPVLPGEAIGSRDDSLVRHRRERRRIRTAGDRGPNHVRGRREERDGHHVALRRRDVSDRRRGVLRSAVRHRLDAGAVACDRGSALGSLCGADTQTDSRAPGPARRGMRHSAAWRADPGQGARSRMTPFFASLHLPRWVVARLGEPLPSSASTAPCVSRATALRGG